MSFFRISKLISLMKSGSQSNECLTLCLLSKCTSVVCQSSGRVDRDQDARYSSTSILSTAMYAVALARRRWYQYLVSFSFEKWTAPSLARFFLIQFESKKTQQKKQNETEKKKIQVTKM